MQKARRQDTPALRREPFHPPTACRHTISGTISLSIPEFFSPFPHGTVSAIGHERVFSLRRWSSQIPTGFPVPRGTWEQDPGSPLSFRLQDYHLLRSLFPELFDYDADW